MIWLRHFPMRRGTTAMRTKSWRNIRRRRRTPCSRVSSRPERSRYRMCVLRDHNRRRTIDKLTCGVCLDTSGTSFLALCPSGAFDFPSPTPLALKLADSITRSYGNVYSLTRRVDIFWWGLSLEGYIGGGRIGVHYGRVSKTRQRGLSVGRQGIPLRVTAIAQPSARKLRPGLILSFVCADDFSRAAEVLMLRGRCTLKRRMCMEAFGFFYYFWVNFGVALFGRPCGTKGDPRSVTLPLKALPEPASGLIGPSPLRHANHRRTFT
jgi:hypothetical protein